MNDLPQPRPHTHIEKFLLNKPLRVISWYGANLIPEINSVVIPRLARKNLANVILASLSLSEPLSLRNSSLTFSGDGAASGTEDYVSTTFDPVDYNLNHGFTVSFWVRPDELGTHMFALGRRRANSTGRFTFGLRSNTRLFVGVGNTKKQGFIHGMEIGNWYH